MELVELQRLRRTATWWLCVVLGIAAIIMLAAHNTTVDVNGSRLHATRGGVAPFSMIVPVAMFAAAIFASSAGLSFNRESMTVDLSWTKPLPRLALAARYIGLDLVAITLAYVVTLLVALLVFTSLGVSLIGDPSLPLLLPLGLGVSLMWYALVLMLTARLGPAGASISGILWPVALVCIGLQELQGTLGVIAHVANVFNPLAYLSGASSDAAGGTRAAWTLPYGMRDLIVWGFTVVYAAAAALLWTRREV